MLRVRVAFSGPAMIGPGVNTTFWIGSNAADAILAAAAASAFWQQVESSMDSGLAWTLETEVAQIDIVSGQLIGTFEANPASGVGDVPGDLLPRMTQGLVRLNTGAFVEGRRVIGHMYVPAPTEGLSTDGTPTAAYISDLQTAADILEDAAPGLVVYSRPKFNNATPPVRIRDGSQHPVNGAVAGNKWAVLRSRRD